ncbi:Ig-like domain-containing protein [Enterobacter bugandensis]|uniref:Ig-like domain-containing protein n=2 Tax=Enterobacter bugandensis TaxID=881260 RepID=UPI002075CF12|nr:Ig-like domain-containing protein [Enterobacter bugandensis]MCM7319110.1 Ig-like domain-containing protein [Enterobacter bugandensis]MCM7354563.1 Ig-like domain-containing protein [Enterobacter bugandensis]
MSIEAKVTSEGGNEAVGSSSTQIITNGTLTLTQSSNVVLNIPPEMVSSYLKEGADLTITLKSGETIKIINFYPENAPASHLFLVNDEDKLVAVDFPAMTSDGPLVASYIPQNNSAGFLSLTESEGKESTLGAMAALLGIAAVGGGIAIVDHHSGSSNSDNSASPPSPEDTTPPEVASDLQITSDGRTISGKAKPGATVGIDTDGDGRPDIAVTAGPDGSFSVSLNPPLTNGQTVGVTVTDPAGNTSPVISTQAPDTTPPDPVTDLQISPDGRTISGKAEPGVTVGIDTDGDGRPDITVTAGPDGSFSASLNPSLTNGQTVGVTVTDPAGNTSPVISTQAPDTTPPDPVTDLQISPEGSTISGKAEPGATVGIDINGDGRADITVTAGPDGSFSASLNPPLTNGQTVGVTVTDPAGNTSPVISTQAPDTTPPDPVTDLQIFPDGSTISGKAEPGTTVGIDINGDGRADITVTVGPDGSFNTSLNPPLTNGQTVGVTVTDPAGNVSPGTSIQAPDFVETPIINPTNGVTISGSAEAGMTIILTDGDNNPLGQTTSDANGNWTFTPTIPLADSTVVNVVAKDTSGNQSPAASAIVDAIAPNTPVIEPSNGMTLHGTAEPGTTVILTDGNSNPIGHTTADADGNWTFTPTAPLADSTVVNVVAKDASGNQSPAASVTVDAIAPGAPVINPTEGHTLSGTAEANSTVVLTDTNNNPIGRVTADAEGNWTFTPSTPLLEGTQVVAVAEDASGNISPPSTVTVLLAPTITVPEASDGWLNAQELSDGIQVNVTVRPGMTAGQVINVTFSGQNGYEITTPHTVTAEDIAAGSVTITVIPPADMGPFPQGAGSITANIDGGPASAAIDATVDTLPPATPVLSVLGTELGILGDAGSTFTVTLKFGGVTHTATVTADGNGKASLDLLTGFDSTLTWDQLLNAQLSVTGTDPAGNNSNVASIGVGENIPQPVTIGNFGLDFALFPPTFGFSGTTSPNASIALIVKTPAGNVSLSLTADENGHFSLNLLSPDVLNELNLTIQDILNLGDQLSFDLTATDTNGNISADYGIGLSASGVTVNLGEIEINGTAGNDVLSGADGMSEHISAGAGDDLILHVGTGDQVSAGDGNDTIEIVQTNFTSIDGGKGFDTLFLADGINLDYNSPGTGTLANIERIDMGTGDTGSNLTLTASEVVAITDGNDTLQITGEANDTLHVAGAVNTGATQQIEGITYDVYSFGNATLLIEENTVKVEA